MSASRTSVEIDSRPSGPTLDLHTDAIILREGPAAVCSTYLTPTPTPTPTATSLSISIATPTASEPSPFIVRRTVFRAAPGIIAVRPGPATERARARFEAKAREAARASTDAWKRGAHGAGRPARSTWPFFAAFALGAAMAASAQMTAGRGVEVAVLAAVIAGVQTLAAAFPGKAHARKGG